MIEIFQEAVEEQQSIRIQDVPEEHRTVFAVWRQHLCSVVLWYKQYSRNKDRGSAINAAMALGKLSSVPKPVGYVSEKVLDDFSLTCEDLWDQLQHNE